MSICLPPWLGLVVLMRHDRRRVEPAARRTPRSTMQRRRSAERPETATSAERVVSDVVRIRLVLVALLVVEGLLMLMLRRIGVGVAVAGVAWMWWMNRLIRLPVAGIVAGVVVVVAGSIAIRFPGRSSRYRIWDVTHRPTGTTIWSRRIKRCDNNRKLKSHCLISK